MKYICALSILLFLSCKRDCNHPASENYDQTVFSSSGGKCHFKYKFMLAIPIKELKKIEADGFQTYDAIWFRIDNFEDPDLYYQYTHHFTIKSINNYFFANKDSVIFENFETYLGDPKLNVKYEFVVLTGFPEQELLLKKDSQSLFPNKSSDTVYVKL